MLNRLETRLAGTMLFESRAFPDERGYFREVFQVERYAELGLRETFVQDNSSYSHAGVLRGMHFQAPFPQGKLVRAVRGRIWDVAVDVRRGSPTFGQWEAYDLSEENGRTFFVPEGFAHGFVVLDGPALVLYKCSGFWNAPMELTLRYDDPDVGIRWPEGSIQIVSPKDEAGVWLRDLPMDRLTPFEADEA
ncbi:MAG: dTDP-4-dehydrorhamnose 3,5-epimerase [Fimbriimonas sp.]